MKNLLFGFLISSFVVSHTFAADGERYSRFSRRLAGQPAAYSDGICSICQEALSLADTLATTPCLHQFHTTCYQDMLQSSIMACPTCRTTIVDETATLSVTDNDSSNRAMPTIYYQLCRVAATKLIEVGRFNDALVAAKLSTNPQTIQQALTAGADSNIFSHGFSFSVRFRGLDMSNTSVIRNYILTLRVKLEISTTPAGIQVPYYSSEIFFNPAAQTLP